MVNFQRESSVKFLKSRDKITDCRFSTEIEKLKHDPFLHDSRIVDCEIIVVTTLNVR